MGVFLSKKNKTLLLLFIGGVLLGFSYNYPLLWFFSFVALFPLYSLIYQNRLAKRTVFLFSLVFGFFYFATVQIWTWHSLPLDWLGIESAAFSILLVLAAWIPGSLFLGLFAGLWAVTARQLAKRAWADPLLFAFLWVIFEYLRMWGVVFFTWGAGSVLEPNYSMGFLGYILAPNHNLLQLAGIGGVYLLSFVLVAMSSFLYLFLKNGLVFEKRAAIPAVLFAAVLLFFPLERLEVEAPPGAPVNVALINAYVPSSLAVSEGKQRFRFETYKSLTEVAAGSGEDVGIVVFPEDSRFVNTLIRNNDLDYFKNLFGEEEVLIIDSGNVRRNEGEPYRLELTYFNTKNGTLVRQEKHYSVFFGEYIPASYVFFMKLFGQGDVVERFIDWRGHQAGGREAKLGVFREGIVGTRFCSEVLSPTLYRDLAAENANVLVNVSAHAWFHGSRVAHNQVKSMIKVRAVENNRYIARSANFSPAFAVDNKGRVINEAAWGMEGVLFVPVYPIEKQSPYNSFLQAVAVH